MQDGKQCPATLAQRSVVSTFALGGLCAYGVPILLFEFHQVIKSFFFYSDWAIFVLLGSISGSFAAGLAVAFWLSSRAGWIAWPPRSSWRYLTAFALVGVSCPVGTLVVVLVAVSAERWLADGSLLGALAGGLVVIYLCAAAVWLTVGAWPGRVWAWTPGITGVVLGLTWITGVALNQVFPYFVKGSFALAQTGNGHLLLFPIGQPILAGVIGYWVHTAARRRIVGL